MGNSSQLTWSTASEHDNHGFDIERSADGERWMVIGFQQGQGTASEYSFFDQTPLAGANYYRLHQLDLSGGSSYSPIRVIDFAEGTPEIMAYPNPAKAEINLVFNEVNKLTSLLLFDQNGRVVLQKQPQYPHEKLDLSSLPLGAYRAVVRSENGTQHSVFFVKY